MHSVRIDVNVYDESGALEIVLDQYDSSAPTSWSRLDEWTFDPGDPFLLGEALSHFEAIADTLARSVGLQLALPFE